MEIPAYIKIHYHGPSGHNYGTNDEGHDYAIDPEGKLTRLYTMNQRTQAVEYAKLHGAAKAGRKYDLPATTIRSWMKRETE